MPRRAFRDWMWSNLGRPLQPCLLQQQILVNVKLGRRKWLNFAKLLAALHTHFSEQSAIYINDPTVVSFTQEVALLQSTTVLIAHNGAISANLIFLPDLATAIVHDVWSAHVGSTRMEQDGHLYAALGHIRVLFYTVKSDEIPEPTSHSPEESPTLVNVARMTELIRYGLQQTVRHLTATHQAGSCKPAEWYVPDGARLNVALYNSTAGDHVQLGANPELAGAYFK